MNQRLFSVLASWPSFDYQVLNRVEKKDENMKFNTHFCEDLNNMKMITDSICSCVCK